MILGALLVTSGPDANTVAAPAVSSARAQNEPTKDSKPRKDKKNKKPKVAKPAPDQPADDSDEEGDAREHVDAPGRFVWRQHPSFRYGSAFRLDFEARLQEDGHASHPAAPGLRCSGTTATCGWELHRNRIGIQGSVFKHIEYEVERELTEQELTERELLEGETPRSQWKDVNVNLTYLKRAQIRVGKFKIPFGLDELTGVTHNDFVYRSLGANYLAPARDIGVQVHGRLFKRGLSYWVASATTATTRGRRRFRAATRRSPRASRRGRFAAPRPADSAPSSSGQPSPSVGCPTIRFGRTASEAARSSPRTPFTSRST
jgi:hypothetical protein